MIKEQDDSGELIPIRGLNEFAYCPRLFHLMYVQRVFHESADTLEGAAQHRRRKARGVDDQGKPRKPWPAQLTKRLILSSPELGIIGKFDAIMEGPEELIVVEDKHGKAPTLDRKFDYNGISLPAAAWPNDQIQVAAQIILLRTHGFKCSRGRVYYRKSGTTAELSLSPEVEEAVRLTAEQARKLYHGPMPPPLLDSPKCLRCSLNAVCLPDETHVLKGQGGEPRKLVPGRDDAGVLYLITPGSSLKKKGDNIRINSPASGTTEVHSKDISHVCIFGHSQISTQAILALVARGCGIFFFSQGGWLKAGIVPLTGKNVLLRREQFLVFSRPENRLEISRQAAKSKILNQRTIIRRNSPGQPDSLEKMRLLAAETEKAGTLEELRGMEGRAAALYWHEFSRLLRPTDPSFGIKGRNRRPPLDPVNAMLSFGYSLLLRDFYSACVAVGLDPLFGFYHSVVAGRPALALDLMEPYRPLVVDSMVLRMINTGSVSKSDFDAVPGCCMMQDSGRRKLLSSYERRVDELITHPGFGYRLSYRRVFHIEARLLGRVLEGELTTYRPLTTR